MSSLYQYSDEELTLIEDQADGLLDNHVEGHLLNHWLTGCILDVQKEMDRRAKWKRETLARMTVSSSPLDAA